MKQKRLIRVADLDIAISVDAEGDVQPTLTLDVTSDELDRTYLLSLKIEAEGTFSLTDFSVEWTIPILDMHGLYWGGNPRTELSYLPYWQLDKHVCANKGIPFIALIDRNGDNRAAFGLFDQLTETALHAELSEAERTYHFRLQKPDFSGQTIRVNRSRHEYMFISRADQPWSKVLQRYIELNDQTSKLAQMPVPEHAFDPVFCTWTAIHHEVRHEWILHNARIAADLGFRTWITDDGWFSEKGLFGDYRHAGDWQPSTTKFPNMRTHVHAVQALGFRYLLWVAPFMVGDASEASQRYAHLLMTGQPENRFRNLAPQKAETRQIVSELLERLVRDYDLDGLKIDFIDSIKPEEAAPQTFGSSLYKVLQEATMRVSAIRSGLLIEFRNAYTNLASRSYSNIYRCSDVPLNYTLNRWQAVMLRLLAPDRAVHLDPALWHPDESDENVAVHLINVIVSVPMISVELDRYPQTHLDLIRWWVGFYNRHRATIIHGDFQPVLLPEHIPLITFKGSNETIIGLYEDVPVTLTPMLGERTQLWILNASTQPFVDFAPSEISGSHRVKVITRDKFGAIINEEAQQFPRERLLVEIGGCLEIQLG